MDLKNGIIITGGIACGKSVVCSELNKRGYTIIDADLIAKDALRQSETEVVRLFNCVNKNGQLDRAKLANVIFNDNISKQKLEDILHPIIYETITSKAAILEAQNKIYFIDIPLFYETGQKYKGSFIVVVYAPRDIQLQRLMLRNNYNMQDAKLRIDAQIDIEYKKTLADYVLDNSGGLQELQKQIDNLLDLLQNSLCNK